MKANIENNYMFKHLKPLIGKKVKGLAVDNTRETLAAFGEPIWGLEFTDGTVVFAMRDPEGNGPGFLDIIPPEKQ